jgi:hypothetical protein
MPVHVLCQFEVQLCNLSHHLHLPFLTGSLGRSTVAILVEDTLLVAFLICNELVLSNLCFLLFLQISFVLSLIALRPLGQGFYNLPFPILPPVLCLKVLNLVPGMDINTVHFSFPGFHHL